MGPLVYEKDREILERIAAMPLLMRLAQPVEMLPLPTRLASACRRLRLRTLGDVVGVPRKTWLFSHNLGRKSMAVLEEQLRLLDLHLEYAPPAIAPTGEPHTTQTLASAALALPKYDRAELVQVLVASLLEN